MATAPRKTPAKASPTSAKRPAARKAPQRQKDAVALLRADHTLVNGLFADYEKARSTSRKKTLVEKICSELGIHMQVEEEIFYPAVKDALRDQMLVPEATVEHATLRDLITQVDGKEPDGTMFDARIKVMAEYVKHHVKEEQTEMFPKVRDAKQLDLLDLGARMSARKKELTPPKPAKTHVLADVRAALATMV